MLDTETGEIFDFASEECQARQKEVNLLVHEASRDRAERIAAQHTERKPILAIVAGGVA